MRVSPLGTPPPSPLLRPANEDGLRANDTGLRLTGQQAVLDTENQEYLEAVPMTRTPRRPLWASNMPAPTSSTAPTGLTASSSPRPAETSFWLKPIWEINGVIIPVKVASNKVDLGGPGMVQALASLSLLSPRLLNQLAADRFSLVAVNKSVVEVSPELKGVRAGGNRSTWDAIPCAHTHDKKTVIFSTKGNYTGCYDSILHELFHAVDDTEANLHSSKKEFQDAYNADKHRIVTPYYLQTGSRGTSGRQETFAEVGARYLAGDSTLKDDLPAIHNYFEERYKDDREFAKTKAAASHFRPTSEIYADKGGYKSLTVAPQNIGTVMSVEEFLAKSAA